jgi:hypothetical protein
MLTLPNTTKKISTIQALISIGEVHSILREIQFQLLIWTMDLRYLVEDPIIMILNYIWLVGEENRTHHQSAEGSTKFRQGAGERKMREIWKCFIITSMEYIIIFQKIIKLRPQWNSTARSRRDNSKIR